MVRAASQSTEGLMFSWFKFRTQDKSAEQLALELQTLCDEYDRRFGVFEHKYVEFSPIGLVALAVTFLFSVLLAGIEMSQLEQPELPACTEFDE